MDESGSFITGRDANAANLQEHEADGAQAEDPLSLTAKALACKVVKRRLDTDSE